MRRRTQDSIFQSCVKEGSFVPLEFVNKAAVRAMRDIAILDYETVSHWAKKAPKKSAQWNSIYKLPYDVLHCLCEALLQLDKKKARTHECLYAYVTKKYNHLQLDWKFFDAMRTKRNGILYYGRPASYDDWKKIETQVISYIAVIKKLISGYSKEN